MSLLDRFEPASIYCMKLSGYLHLHTTYSYDGKVPLAELKAGLVARGARFACVTEHTDWLTKDKFQAFFEECQALSDESILLIPGLEVSFPDAHILMAGLKTVLDPQLPALELVKQGKEQEAFIVFAHPHRSSFQAPEGVEPLLEGIEIWNGQYDGKRSPRPAAWKYRDRLAERSGQMLVTSGVDLHRWSHLPGPGLEVEVEIFRADAIIQSLKQGKYCITGHRSIIAANETYDARPDKVRLNRESAWAIWFIKFARKINAFLTRFRIRLPKKFRESIRKRI